MKIYELLIDEEDELSGVSLLSLVKSPATQLSWEVFNDHICEAECFADVDINPDLLSVLDKYGEKLPEGVFDWVEIMNDEEYETIEKFYSVASQPNRKDPVNDFSLDSITRYIYTIDTGAGAVLKPESRQFCRKMIAAGRVYSRADLARISAEIAADPDTFKIIPRPNSIPDVDTFEFKGGKSCFHRYKILVFNLKPNQTYDELLASIPARAAQGITKADMVMEGSDRPFLSEALHYNFGKRKSLKPSNFYMGLFFYDDVFSALIDEPKATKFTKIKMGEYEGWCPMYVAEEYFEGGAKVIDRFEVKEMFVQVPEYIREAAQRAQDWAEENGWGSCGTPVGKRRSADLADGNYNASTDILARMYSYGSRHKQDWESSKSFDDGCGSLMMASWGFTPSNYDEAMKWLEGQLDKATMKQQNFAVDNFKGEITAVVFEPDTYIYRFSEGKSYYVFMSKETIKKMLMKVSRLKESGKMENFINLEHTDKIFKADDVYTYENWLVGDDPMKDKSYEIFGREMKPGTWITTIAFRNKDLFEKYVLSNKTTGISLEGLFQEVPFNFNEVSRETFVEPRPGESEDDFISRCIPYLINEGKTQDQAAGACYGMYGEKFGIEEDKEMVDGVIDLLLQVNDLENRKEIAKEIIRDFALEGVSYDYDDFLQRIGIEMFAEVGERGGIKESDKAPKSDTPNRDPKGEGTAKGDASNTRSAEVPKEVEETLQKKSDDFNERYKDKLGYGSTLGMLKSVYQRGVGAYNTSHSPEVKSAGQWAMARVNAFLYLIKNGRPQNPKYTTDYDLLPGKHPKKVEMDINTSGMSPYTQPATTGLTTEEVFEYVGDYEGAPAYSTESGADSKAKEMGCEGTHFMEGQGYFPCKTHKEAADLYESQKIYEMIVDVMKNYKND